ncbi:MAG TPA: M15 family metallopeptidase [Arenimonas sp.]|nr:M15 family metallopeptidase [Arenimonas sp.]
MRRNVDTLLNTEAIELWPAPLLRARSNADARVLARANRVLRRKRDGRFIAADLPQGLMPLLPRWQHEPGLHAALDALDAEAQRRSGISPPAQALPMSKLEARLAQLGLDARYGERTGLPLVAEPDRLALAGFDRFRRPLWLLQPAARAWQRLRAAAAIEGIALDAISGYRSHDYQLGIFERKRARGLSVDEILAVNAAPGYSEHHGGCALDIGTPGEPPAEESFEATPAFSWLSRHAGGFGFALSYPRGNPHGINYEPWHWCWRPAGDSVGCFAANPLRSIL